MARKLLGVVPNVGDSSNKEAPTSWITSALNLKLDKTGLSASTPLSYNSGTGVLSIQAASLVQDGYLSSANFNAFNNKENAISSGTTSQYWRGDKSWQDLPSAIRGTVLSGLVAGTNQAITATDSILIAFQNLQAQINNKLGSTAQATDSDKLDGQHGSYYQTALGFTPLKNTTDTFTGNLTLSAGSLYLPAAGFSGAGPIQSTIAIKFANGSSAQEAYMQKLRLGGTWSTLDSNDPGDGGIYANGNIKGASFVKTGGTSSQFLKADGSVDSTAYSTTSHNHSGIYAPTSHSHSTLTFSSSGGAAAGTSYNGTVDRIIDYSTVGAAAAGHNHDSAYTPIITTGLSIDTGINYGVGGTPVNGYLITTTIPWTQWGMYTVEISGYEFHSSNPFTLLVSWYLNNNPGRWVISQQGAIAKNVDVGTVTISKNAGGFITIHLSRCDYYRRFRISAFESTVATSTLRGWSVSDAVSPSWADSGSVVPRQVITSANIGSQNVYASGYSSAVNYSPNRTDSTAYPVLWGVQGTYSGQTGTVAYSCAKVTIQSSTGKLSAESLAASTTLYAPGDSIISTEDGALTWRCNDFEHQIISDGINFKNLQGVDVAYFNLHVPGVNFNCSVTATGNITAYYSDERLKENVRSIDNALNRVKTLSGVYYNSNDLAASYGYTDKNNQVGVLAQQVQKVLPEAIALAPFDDNGSGLSKSGQNFLTVKYEKIIPLLIEAIKEQQKQIDELKNA